MTPRYVLFKLVILDDIFRHSYEAFLEPEGLDDLDVGFERHKCAEELLDIMEFTHVAVAGFL